METRLMSH